MRVRGMVSAAVLLVAGVVLAALVAGDVAAQSPVKLFRGETGQGKRVAVRVGTTGRVERVTIAWTARCRRHKDAVVRDDSIIQPPRRGTTTEVFRASGTYRLRQRGGYRLRVRLYVRGLRDTGAGERWTGTIRGTVTVRWHGRSYDSCRLMSTVWSATLPPPPGATTPTTAPTQTSTTPATTTPSSDGSRTVTPGPWRFEMTGDSGDYITGGQNWVHQPPNDNISASGGSGYVTFSIGTADGGNWSVDFAAAPGDTLRAGVRYAGARRYPFNDNAPGLSISGMGRGCNTLTGEFTVHAIEFDARGLLKRFAASFEQHCEGGTPAARGTMDFTAA